MACVQMLSFSVDTGAESLPPLVCHVVYCCLFEVISSLLPVAVSAEPSRVWLLVHELLPAAPNLVG